MISERCFARERALADAGRPRDIMPLMLSNEGLLSELYAMDPEHVCSLPSGGRNPVLGASVAEAIANLADDAEAAKDELVWIFLRHGVRMTGLEAKVIARLMFAAGPERAEIMAARLPTDHGFTSTGVCANPVGGVVG